jgi:hypothetical protein
MAPPLNPFYFAPLYGSYKTPLIPLATSLIAVEVPIPTPLTKLVAHFFFALEKGIFETSKNALTS